MTPDAPARGPTRCGFVTLLGAPNAGKSTLLNRLVGTKVSIVSAKVQTTRAQIRGIWTDRQHQVIFVDTPGVFQGAKRPLERSMVEAAWEQVAGADVRLILVDAATKAAADQGDLLRRLRETPGSGPTALVLNKTDLIATQRLLPLSQTLNAAFDFDATFMISAEHGHGLKELRAWVSAAVPAGPFLYPADQVSDAPERHLAAEVTREHLFNALHQELPYHLTVETEGWKETPKGVRIDQTIYVARDSHKAMVLGKGGALICRLGQAARQDLAKVLGMPVHLFLFVKVRKTWLLDPERYAAMGLTLSKA